MNVGFVDSAERSKTLLKEIERARVAIENAPAKDTYQSSKSRVLIAPQGDVAGGSVEHVSWMKDPRKIVATVRNGDITTVYTSEVFKKDTSKSEAAAAGLGALAGALLAPSKKNSGGTVVGAILGGLTAWAAVKKTVEGPGERRIEVVETTPHGITTEKLVFEKGECSNYASSFHVIGAPKPFDPEAAKKAIENLKV